MLYHYTNYEALEGILTNQELWMTTHHYLNDTQEYVEGFDRIKSIVQTYISDNISILNESQVNAINQTLEWLDDTVLLVTSFSKAKDRKSQWEYGNFSIEFDEKHIKTSYQNGIVFALRPCLYDKNEKDRQAKLIGETYLKAFAKNPQKMDLYNLFIGYMEYLTRAKSEHFFEEEEIRLSSYTNINNENVYALKHGEVGQQNDAPILSSGPVKIFSELEIFENTHNKKLHYSYPIDIANSIKSITISSKLEFEEAHEKISKLLGSLNLQIEIKKSEVPFRVSG